MSRFSGKCDLYDHLNMMHPDQKSDNSFQQDLDNFVEFKRRTSGLIYQNLELKLTSQNIEQELNMPYNQHGRLTRERVLVRKPDRRYKQGFRTTYVDTYEFLGNEYKTLKDLNRDYVAYKVIVLDTIWDLIPYYSYIISIAMCGPDQDFICISQRSFVDISEQDHRQYSDQVRIEVNHYNKVLQQYVIDMTKYITQSQKEAK